VNAAADSAQEGIPDWLVRIRERENLEKGKPEEKEPKSPENSDSEIPDWLTEFKVDSPDEKSPAGSTSAKAGVPPSDKGQPADDDNDWLKKLESWQPEKPRPEEKPADEEPKAVQAAPPQGSKDEENWLKIFKEESEEDSQNEEPSAQPSPVTVNGDSSSAFLPDEPAPVDDLISSAEEEKNLPEPAASAGTVPSENDPAKPEPSKKNWLNDFTGIKPDENLAAQVLPPTNNEDQPKAPFTGDQSMSFLDEAASETPAAASEPSKILEPANLPAWIKALNPKQSEEGSPQDNPALTNTPFGPLAGIEGVLKGEELLPSFTPPHTFTGTIKVTENQQARAQILKNIADQSRWEDEGLEEKSRSSHRILHGIVAALMLLAVWIPLVIKGSPSVLPALYPGEVVQAFNTINALPVDKPVLVAADFDGSLYGELSWSLQPLLSQIMAKNIAVAYLSTNSAGATLFSKALDPLVIRYPNYSNPGQLVNLGYLAGGSIGLQSLARDPVTTLPLTASLQPAWQSKPFNAITKISDFGALIVITENADTAKYWIEQVKPSLGTTPLIVVISAQSAPLLQPYYDSGQVTGYISGLYSAVAFESLAKDPQSATGHLSSFQITLILVVLLILVGGIASLILYRPKTEKKPGKPA
jgi:hypothetical protein